MSDDQTKVLDNEAKPTPPTQPTIETVLERINALGEKLSGEIAELRTGQGQILAQLTRLNAKVDVMNRELLEVKANQELERTTS